MKSKLPLIFGLILFCIASSCQKNSITATASNGTEVTGPTNPTKNAPPHPSRYPVQRPGPPNIIFLLADDVGYEMPTFDGGQSYNTSHLDSLAANAMVFTQCRATALCSPSRVELLSGLYNFRNYLGLGWGYYDAQYTSYAKILQNNGYKTCVVGKWQLDGGSIGIENVGFDDFCVWEPQQVSSPGYLYRSPHLYDENGFLPAASVQGKYSEDITGDYAMNFIDQNKNVPFFIYYSFMLVHNPLQPTPLDQTFLSFDELVSDTTYIGSMTHYLDIKVGALINKLKADGLDKNTIIVFSGDNGSANNYHSIYKGQEIEGEKGRTTELGTHVPLFVYWPGHINPGINDNLVDFSDFAPTFLDMAKVTKPTGLDGVSFYPQLFGNNGSARTWTYCYYDPFPIAMPPLSPQTAPESYAQDTAYKLYKTGVKAGKFYHFTTDPEEVHRLLDARLTPAQVAIKQKLQAALNGLQ